MFRQILLFVGLLPAFALAQSVNINGNGVSVDAGDTKVRIGNASKGNVDKKMQHHPKTIKLL